MLAAIRRRSWAVQDSRLDFTSALYLGLHHGRDDLRPWAQLTSGVPAALHESCSGRRQVSFVLTAAHTPRQIERALAAVATARPAGKAKDPRPRSGRGSLGVRERR
jgi:hypothetical protein